ncbi:MAG TPA: serine hydrolase [Candidatus Baltobacteraceae bacterium]|nr:serine hydrolase [Candidatus Baltobacteraceae bacterium]
MIFFAPPVVAAGVPSVPTPAPRPTSTAPISERSMLDTQLDALSAQALKTTGGTLGVVILDLGSGVRVERNAQMAFPLADLQRLPLAVLTYAAIDSGKVDPNRAGEMRDLVARMLGVNDAAAANTLYADLGGADALNALLHAIGIDGVVYRTDEAGLEAQATAGRTFAKGGDNAGSPDAIALMLTGLAKGELLSAPSRTALLDALAAESDSAGRLRGGLPANARFEHEAGTSQTFDGVVDGVSDAGIAHINGRSVILVAMLRGARGTSAERDALLVSVARIANDATRLFPLR